jgi:predicted negative regulator of RcsB-dependent stress response
MAYDHEEQEHLDALKAWWKQYGRLVIVAVLGGTLAIGGVQGWRYYQSREAAAASNLFEQLQKAEEAREHKKVKDIAGQIESRHARTHYAALAALAAAKSDVETGDLASAKKRLQQVVSEAKEDEVRDIARLRLARVQFDEKDLDGTLKTLEAAHGAAFDGLFADLRGDVLQAQGKRSDARAAYQLARDKSEATSPLRQIIQMKLDALGEGKR